MADIEKVIKGLEICKNHDGSHCLECPYFVDECVDDLCADALELIDTQYKLIRELQNLISAGTKMLKGW